MACINAMCRKLKKIFSSDKPKIEHHPHGRVADTITINPFAPINETMMIKINDQTKRRTNRKLNRKTIRKALRFSSGESCSVETSIEHSVSVSLHVNIPEPTKEVPSRYKSEFQELGMLGTGEFGSVYRCLHRLDGRIYAVKRSRPLTRSAYGQRRATNEVHANAVLTGNIHVVRYYSAWLEEDRINIQQEFCTAGDLAATIRKMTNENTHFHENELRRMIIHIADGLRYIHGIKLAHMDIKPENIFITKEQGWSSKKKGFDVNDCKVDNDCEFEDEIIYKIGDLGHVASLTNTFDLEDEGDCRYLSKEILKEDYTDLTKADVFALGLTIYEAAGGGPLPKNGSAWHEIRDGHLKKLTRYSDEFNLLIREMIHVDPKRRPSAADLVRHKYLYFAG